jgi:hypothetical protein
MADDIDRRRFSQTVGAAGVFSAFGGFGGQRPAADDFPKPAGLRQGGQLEGHWGSAGSLGRVTHHDRSNSKA